MYIEEIIKEKRRLMAQGVDPETMLIKLRRPVAEWLTIEKIVDWRNDRQLMGVRAKVDEDLQTDFEIVCNGESS